MAPANEIQYFHSKKFNFVEIAIFNVFGDEQR